MNKKLEEAIGNNWIKSEPVDLGGVKYWTFDEKGIKMSQARFEAFSDILVKHEAFKTTSEDVESFLASLEESLKVAMLDIKASPSHAYDNLDRAKMLINNFRERQALGNPLERSFELASFLYIQEDENPFDYNEDINKEKIQRWKKKAESVYPIILERALPSFWQLREFFQISFLNSMRGNLEESRALIMNQLLSSSIYERENGTIGMMQSRMETLNSVITLYTDLLKNATNLRLKNSQNQSESKLKSDKEIKNG